MTVRRCLGDGGAVVPRGWLGGDGPDAPLSWGDAYPGSGPDPGEAERQSRNLADVPGCPDQACLDIWARLVLEAAWKALGYNPSETVIQSSQAISRMLANYGWPGFPRAVRGSRDMSKWWGHHNWGAVICETCVETNTCFAPAFVDMIEVREGGSVREISACFEHANNNDAGAKRFIEVLLGSAPAANYAMLEDGDASLIARSIFKTTTDRQAAIDAELITRHAYAIAQNQNRACLVRTKDPILLGHVQTEWTRDLPELPQPCWILGAFAGAALLGGILWGVNRTV